MKYQSIKASAITPAHPPTAPPTVLPVFVNTDLGGGVAVGAIERDGLEGGDPKVDKDGGGNTEGDEIGDGDRV